MAEFETPDFYSTETVRHEFITINHNNPEQNALDDIRQSHYYPLRGLLAEVTYFDPQNGPHGLRVASSYTETCFRLAEKLRFPDAALATLLEYRFGAVLHDIAKTAGTQDFYESIAILNGSFPMGPNGEDTRTEEFKLFSESHTVIAPYILKVLEDTSITKRQAKMTIEMARQHHNFDGPTINGDRSKHSYPNRGLEHSPNLPLLGTANLLLSLCDINDALTVPRDYQNLAGHYTAEQILQELKDNAKPERIKTQSGNLIAPTLDNQRILAETVMSTLPHGYTAPEPESLVWGKEPFIRVEDRKGKVLEALVKETWRLHGDDILLKIDNLQKANKIVQ